MAIDHIDTPVRGPDIRAMLDAYLARIGLADRPAPTAEGLAQVQRAHRLSIGFENLDAMLGRPIVLDLPAVWAKLGGRRGGYCFEHNAVFGAVLAALGMPNRPLLARVWLGLDHRGEAPPRTHTLRLVDVSGQPWLADAGFGGSYVPPLPLIDGAKAEAPDGARHRLTRIGVTGAIDGAWLLERHGPATATDGRTITSDGWVRQYSFDLAEVAPVDLELSNWWTSTRPGTRFTTSCVASIVLDDGFASLNGRRLSLHTGGRGTVTEIASAPAWRATLAELFHIDLDTAEAERLF